MAVFREATEELGIIIEGVLLRFISTFMMGVLSFHYSTYTAGGAALAAAATLLCCSWV